MKYGYGRSKKWSAGACAVALSVRASCVPEARAGQQTATRNFEKTLTLGANQTLSLESKFGEIRIHGENGREAKITATIRAQAGSQGEADKDVEEIKIEVSQDAEGIKVRTVYPEDHVVLRIHKNSSYSVDYDISMPADSKLWLRSGFGNVDRQRSARMGGHRKRAWATDFTGFGIDEAREFLWCRGSSRSNRKCVDREQQWQRAGFRSEGCTGCEGSLCGDHRQQYPGASDDFRR